jgi:hypothetical protein
MSVRHVYPALTEAQLLTVIVMTDGSTDLQTLVNNVIINAPLAILTVLPVVLALILIEICLLVIV